MRIHRDERGQTIILVALSLPLLLGFIGIATDVGALFKDKRTMQTAADAAAIAGALNPSSGAQITAAKAASAANGYTDGSNGTHVTVNNPPTWPASNYLSPTGTPNGYVEVTITKTEPTIFLALFGYPSVTVLARAVATSSGSGGGTLYTLGATGTTLSISANLNVPGGGIIVDSTDTSAMNLAGSVTANSIGIVGGCNGCSGATPPQAVSGIIPYSDPLSFLPQTSPSGSCTNSLNATGGTVFLSPGCYTAFNETGATVTLSPGTYVINSSTPTAILAGGTLSGTGVTLYINAGSLTINNTAMNLTAPIGGTFNGILFQQSSADSSDATIIGNPSSNLQGFFYFPNNALILSGSFANSYTGFVAKSLNITTSSMTINNYASLPNVTSPIISAVLVE
jgi:Flp pilus assembly protein TadG